MSQILRIRGFKSGSGIFGCFDVWRCMLTKRKIKVKILKGKT